MGWSRTGRAGGVWWCSGRIKLTARHGGDGVGEEPPLDRAALVFATHPAVSVQQVAELGVDRALDPVVVEAIRRPTTSGAR